MQRARLPDIDPPEAVDMLPVKIAQGWESPRIRRLVSEEVMGKLHLHHLAYRCVCGRPAVGRAAKPQHRPKPLSLHEAAMTTGTPTSLVMSSSQLRRRVGPPRRCPSRALPEPSATMRAGWPPRHQSAAASRSTSSSRPCRVASSGSGPAPVPMLNGHGGSKSRTSLGRRKHRSAGTRTSSPFVRLAACVQAIRARADLGADVAQVAPIARAKPRRHRQALRPREEI